MRRKALVDWRKSSGVSTSCSERPGFWRGTLLTELLPVCHQLGHNVLRLGQYERTPEQVEGAITTQVGQDQHHAVAHLRLLHVHQAAQLWRHDYLVPLLLLRLGLWLHL